MSHLIFAVVLVAAALTFALLEIQIEGANGWASGLPTWRVENRWTRWLLGSRELTGYHLYVHLFVFVLIHLPYAVGEIPFSLGMEARILSFLIAFWILEDYLWFVFNPSFGARRFRKEHAWWHAPAWWWIMPREYWLWTPVALLFYLWSYS